MHTCDFADESCLENGDQFIVGDFHADDTSSGIYYAEFDLEKLCKYRSSEMIGNTFRKVKAYSELLNPEIKEPFIRKL